MNTHAFGVIGIVAVKGVCPTKCITGIKTLVKFGDLGIWGHYAFKGMMSYVWCNN